LFNPKTRTRRHATLPSRKNKKNGGIPKIIVYNILRVILVTKTKL